MQISLENIIPDPLKDSFQTHSDVWGKTLTIESGEFVHVSAPSGSGKTTLVSLLYGLRNDYSGALKLEGKSSASFTPDQWSEYRSNQLSVVFQDLDLLMEITALENILIKNQLTNHFTLTQIKELATALGIDHRLNAKAGELSRGEKQRVCILRALCMPFKWLILDEPFSHLDDQNTQKAIEVIQSVVDQNKAGIILVNLFKDSYFKYSTQFSLV